MTAGIRQNPATQVFGIALVLAVVLLGIANAIWPSAPLASASILAVGAAGVFGVHRRRGAERTTLALIDAIDNRSSDTPARVELPNDEFGLADRLNAVFDAMRNERDRLTRHAELARRSFESSAEAVYWLDESGVILDVNAAACAAHGQPYDALVGATVFDIDPEITPELWCERWQLGLAGKLDPVETTHTNTNGEDFPVRVSCSHIQQAGRTVVCCTVRDLSDERRIENAILSIVGGTQTTSQLYFDELCKALADALGVKHTIIAECNGEQTATMRSWWDGKDIQQGISYDLAGTPCERAVADGFCLYPSNVRVHFPGDDILAELGIESYAGMHLRDSDGRTIGILIAMDDRPLRNDAMIESLLRLFGARAAAEIERLRTESELLEARDRARRLAAVAESTDNTVFIMDVTNRLYWVNRAFTDITGYTPEEVTGKTPFEIFRGAGTDDAMFADLQRQLDTRQHIRAVVKLHRKDGSSFWSEINASPTFDESGEYTGYISIERDITDQLEQRNRLARAQVRAEAANRAKSEFLANMSHEIRTPMAAILGYTELLDGDAPLDPRHARDAVSIIRRNGEHLLAIVNDILDLSKIEAGKMSVERVECDPVALVRQVVSLMDVRASGKGIRLLVECDGKIPERVRTDPTRFRQILANLVGNAIKFTEVGSVTVRISLVSQSGAPRLRVDVADTGIGMDEHQQAAAAEFNAFSQMDASAARKFGGTGLGLRISRALTRLLGGDITFESELGRGSTFTFTFDPGPLEDVRLVDMPDASGDPDPADAPQTRPSTSARLDGLRVLFAEDGPDNQRLIGFQLEKAGARVTLANNGLEAIERFDDCPPGKAPFDLVLMDMQMPELDGYEAARELRRRGHTLPIIAITAHAMDGERERCLDAGCDEYLAKPIPRATLLGALSAAVASARAEAA